MRHCAAASADWDWSVLAERGGSRWGWIREESVR